MACAIGSFQRSKVVITDSQRPASNLPSCVRIHLCCANLPYITYSQSNKEYLGFTRRCCCCCCCWFCPGTREKAQYPDCKQHILRFVYLSLCPRNVHKGVVVEMQCSTVHGRLNRVRTQCTLPERQRDTIASFVRTHHIYIHTTQYPNR